MSSIQPPQQGSKTSPVPPTSSSWGEKIAKVWSSFCSLISWKKTSSPPQPFAARSVEVLQAERAGATQTVKMGDQPALTISCAYAKTGKTYALQVTMGCTKKSLSAALKEIRQMQHDDRKNALNALRTAMRTAGRAAEAPYRQPGQGGGEATRPPDALQRCISEAGEQLDKASVNAPGKSR
jgi:hypothetical protein